jgi:hypothetical protein
MKQIFLKLTGLLVIFVVILNSCKKDDDITSTYTEKEPNGTFATASELDKTNTYDAKIDPAQDQDYFFIDATSNIEITVDGDNSLELYVNAYDENQVQIYGGDTGARGASLTHTINSSEYSGKLYIFVESAYPDDTGTYTIRLK